MNRLIQLRCCAPVPQISLLIRMNIISAAGPKLLVSLLNCSLSGYFFAQTKALNRCNFFKVICILHWWASLRLGSVFWRMADINGIGFRSSDIRYRWKSLLMPFRRMSPLTTNIWSPCCSWNSTTPVQWMIRNDRQVSMWRIRLLISWNCTIFDHSFKCCRITCPSLSFDM